MIVQPVSIDGNGATIVRAANAEQFRIFNVGVGGNLKLRDLTVKGGDAPAEFGGGGLLVQQGGRATIQDSTFTLNRTDSDGGAIANFGITLIIGGEDHGKDGKDGKDESTLLKNNHAVFDGGAVYSEGSLTVEKARLAYNAAGEFGGAIENNGGVANLTKTRVDNNDAVSDSGGIDTDNGAITQLKDNEVTDNTSGRDGGGLGVFGGSSLYVRHSEVKGNTAFDDGGGIGNFDDSKVVVEDSEVDKNTSFDFGGGVNNFGEESEFVIRDSSVSRNRAVGEESVGGGIANSGDARLALTDTKVIENFATNPPGGVFTDNDEVEVDDETVIVRNRPTNCAGSDVEVPNCFG